MKRVLLIDDHGVVRRGLGEILREEFDGLHVGEAGDGETGLQALREATWDLVLLDIALPGHVSGMEILTEAKRLRPEIPVLMLSASPETELAIRSHRLGASGYLCKQRATEELVQAAREVARGGTFFPGTTPKELENQPHRTDTSSVHDRLSPREFEILRLIAQDKSVKEIASILSLSDKTVSTYIVRIREKTGLITYVEMTRYALRHQLVG